MRESLIFTALIHDLEKYTDMSSRFDYLIAKIEDADFSEHPFKHIEITNFLNEDDFNEIISCTEVNMPECGSDSELFEVLFGNGYQMIPFPGAITDHLEYIRNRRKNKDTLSHSATESAGVVLRLTEPKSNVLIQFKEFIESEKFNSALAKKFGIEYSDCTKDSGVQKYLDQYEISPHPDLRKKALTFMLNINPAKDSESANHHTHYLTFKPERKYVGELWKGNPLTERCWVPWDWCDTVKQQKQNNSIVIFSPSFDTMHAVKASYCHLKGQRTQAYGNLWYKEGEGANFVRSTKRLDWWDFDFQKEPVQTASDLLERSMNYLRRKVLGDKGKKIDSSRSDHY